MITANTDILLTKKQLILRRLASLADEDKVLPYGTANRLCKEFKTKRVYRYAKEAGFLLAPKDDFKKQARLVQNKQLRERDKRCSYCGRYLIGVDKRSTRYCSLHTSPNYRRKVRDAERRVGRWVSPRS